MVRKTHYMAILGVVSGLVLATPAAAVGQTAIGTGCVVQHVNDRGDVAGTSAAPEDAVYGQFRCVAGQWKFAWAPFGPNDAITAGAIQVNPAGAVSVREFAGSAPGDLTMAEMAGITGAITGSKDAVIDRAVVAVDDGKERTAAEIEALLAGKDTTGVRVLDIVEKPGPAMTVDDIVNQVGTQEPTVVYFSILGAIKSAISWVVDRIEDAGNWVVQHCTLEPAFDGHGVEIRCTWGWG